MVRTTHNASERSGRFIKVEVTQLRRHNRTLEDLEFKIQSLKAQLKRLDQQGFGVEGLNKVTKDGMKSLQKELKDVRYLISTLEAELKEVKASKATISSILEVKAAELDTLDPFSKSTKISPEVQSSIDSLDLSYTNLVKEVKKSESKALELSNQFLVLEREEEKIKQGIKGFKRDISRIEEKKNVIEVVLVEEKKIGMKSELEWEKEIIVATELRDINVRYLKGMRERVEGLRHEIEEYKSKIKVMVMKGEDSKLGELQKMEENFHQLIESICLYHDKIEEAKTRSVDYQKELQNRFEKLVEVQDLVKLDQHQTSKLNRRILTLTKELKLLQSTHSTLLARNQNSAFRTAQDYNRCIESIAAPNAEMERDQLEVLTYPVRSKIVGAENQRNELKEVEQGLASRSKRKVDASRIRYEEELDLVREEGDRNKEKVKELEEKLRERVGSRRTEVIPRMSSSKNAKSNSSITSTLSSSSIVPKLLSTVKLLNLELSRLRDENMNLILQSVDA